MAAKKETKKDAKTTDTKDGPQDRQHGSAANTVAREEQIGYHKGCLSTLLKERQELLRIVGIVEQLVQFHLAGLRDLGVDVTKEPELAGAAPSAPQVASNGRKPPIDEII